MILSILLILATLGLGFYASRRVQSDFNRFSQYPSSSGLTGAQVAQAILQANHIRDVQVVPVAGQLTDHYDPAGKKLALSEPVYHSSSLAAQGVAAHECGHALQHAKGYAPLQLRMGAVSLTNMASGFVGIGGFVLMLMNRQLGLWVMSIGFTIIMLFNLITLPVEFDASRRAKQMLSQMGIVRSGEEAGAVNKVLSSAALTYVAAFLSSFAMLLQYVLPLLGGNNSDEES
jgi:uncharacterized protein